jgi:CDP-diacylglycerol--serine O-phosphatidyltransferase
MDLHRAKYLLPNSVTMSSALCGFVSIHLSITGETTRDFSLAAWLIVFAMIFDLLDGRVARMTKTESDLGVQLDSLADALSFGIAPAFLMYAWGLEPLGILGLVAAFVYAACTILRLARFNVMAAEHDGVMRYFLGLPAPLAAGAVVSIVMAHLAVTGHPTTGATGSVVMMSALLGGLMVSNIKYRTFKDVNFRGRAGIGLVALAVFASGLGVAFKPSVAFVGIMVCYILVGLVGTAIHWSRAILGDDAFDYSEDEEMLAEERES